MIAGSDFVGYVLSAGGVVACLVAAAIWMAIAPSSRRARRFLVVAAAGFLICSVYEGQYLLTRIIVGSLRPFEANAPTLSAPEAAAASGRTTAIVVLGSGSLDVEDWTGRRFSFVDRTAAARVLEAARVFSLVDHAIVISSGGNPHPERRSAPTGETMRDALITLGVPRDRIIVESVSKTTREEAIVVAGILREREVEQVILVTSEIHMPRALGAFRAAGIRPVPAVAQEFERDLPWTRVFLPSKEGLAVATMNAHELLGVVYYWLRGWWRR